MRCQCTTTNGEQCKADAAGPNGLCDRNKHNLHLEQGSLAPCNVAGCPNYVWKKVKGGLCFDHRADADADNEAEAEVEAEDDTQIDIIQHSLDQRDALLAAHREHHRDFVDVVKCAARATHAVSSLNSSMYAVRHHYDKMKAVSLITKKRSTFASFRNASKAEEAAYKALVQDELGDYEYEVSDAESWFPPQL